MLRRLAVFCCLLTGCSPSSIPDEPEGAYVEIPEQSVDDEALRAEPILRLDTPAGATRASALVTLAGEITPRLYARALDASGPGTWQPMRVTWREDGMLVAVTDLDRVASEVELRVEGEVTFLTWSAVIPEPVRERPDVGAARLGLSAEIAALGVIPREDWGARATRCSDNNASKYRIAVHHTVTAAMGDPASNLRGIQSYHMDGRGWCDVGYHFLVSLDGRVWEGRPVHLLGAHVGGHNTGNIGVSFMGCFHPTSDCTSFPPQVPPDGMIAGAAGVIAGLAEIYAIPRDATSIKGHRDHSGSTTACPGDHLHARLNDLRSGMAGGPAWGAQYVAQSFPLASAPFELAPGEPSSGYLEMRNVGTETWRPGETFLGTTEPRDGASPIAGDDWPSDHRAATIDRVVAPNETGRFVFSVRAPLGPGDYPQYFNLVQEGVAWFGDPGQGGPADDQIQIRMTTLDVAPWEPADAGVTPPLPTDGGADGGEGRADGGVFVPVDAGDGAPLSSGCGCRVSGRSPAALGWGLALLGLVSARRIRRRAR